MGDFKPSSHWLCWSKQQILGKYDLKIYDNLFSTQITLSNWSYSQFKDFLNKSRVHNAQQLLDCINNRPKGKPLITLCNHDSCCDDPLVFGN